MKNFCVSLFALLTITAFSQQNFQGKAIYKSKTTMDMNFGGRQMSEDQKKRMAERMKSFLEKTFILNFTQTESVYKEEATLGAPNQRGGGRFGRGMSLTGGLKYKNTKEGIVLEETEFLGKEFLISEDSKKPEWKLGSETKKIGNYTCFKATLEKEVNPLDVSNMSSFFRRRNNADANKDKEEKPKTIMVTAWYTPQIPVSQGPAEYWGLPGLILEISEGNTTVLCSEIVMNTSDKIEIKAPKKGKKVTREEYTKIVVKKMEEMREQFRGRGGNRGGGRG